MTARDRLITNLARLARQQGYDWVGSLWIEEEVQAPYLADLANKWLDGAECWTGRQIARLKSDINKTLDSTRLCD